jgi:hypothetical protein
MLRLGAVVLKVSDVARAGVLADPDGNLFCVIA